MKTWRRRGVFLLAFLAALLLLADSCTYALQPAEPEIGRRSACFTMVELALGLKEPSIVRYIQFLAAWAVLLGLPILSIRSKLKRRQAALARSAAAPPGERCDVKGRRH